MKREPNITRIDHGRSHAWWVRFQRGTINGKRSVVSRLFSDALHGSKRAALREAVAWRNDMARRLPAPLRPQTQPVPVGYGYVKRQVIWRRAGYHDVWLAWIRVAGGRARSTTYSVRLWGERGARRECERWLAERRTELGKRPSGSRRRAA